MKYKKLDRVDKIAAWRLCMGCGACAYVCPNNAISLVDIVKVGIRPVVDESKCEKCTKCIEVCPGVGLEHKPFPDSCIDELKEGWGPILQLCEGYASDENIRYVGSSGGATTTLGLYALQSGIAAGVLHIGVDNDNPIRNVPVYSTTKEQLLACSGSRYAPAAPCQAFDIIKRQAGKSIFIGKPCDVAALSKARKLDAELDKKVALTISIFCAGTPTTKGTLAVLQEMDVGDTSELESFRYRGNGWPGNAVAKVNSQAGERTMTYAHAWGDILSKHGQLRCRLCPDSTGEFADIACGDPWYRETDGSDPGRSLILARTNAGKKFLDKAVDSGIVKLDIVTGSVLPDSQKSVYRRRQQLWGRLAVFKVFYLPHPVYKGFSLRCNWRALPLMAKIRTIVGTVRRIVFRKWFVPMHTVDAEKNSPVVTG